MTHDEDVALRVPGDAHECVVSSHVLDDHPSTDRPLTLRHDLSVRPASASVESQHSAISARMR
ncbi:MAG: hypothetical protein QOH79_3841 [Acidimicrobiaceae bacterium]